MKSRNQQQLSVIQMAQDDNMFQGAEKEPSRDVQADVVMDSFSFGPFRVAPFARLLERAGLTVPLSSRAFDLLCLLVSRPGEVVSKGELIAKTWPNVTVEESCLRFHITQLRRALGDSKGGERYVINVPGRGYCFVACVRREALVSQRSGRKNCDKPNSLAVREPAPTRWQKTKAATVLHHAT